MKKISSAILAAVALAAFGFVSCDHDYSNSDIQAGTPSKVKQAEIDAADKGGSDEEEPEANITVDAAWDFSTQPTGFPTSDGDTDAVTALALASTSGSGATLTATGRWKWKDNYIQAQASSGKSVADAATWTTTSGGKWLTLTLAGKAKVTLKYAGAGDLDAKRFVAVVSGSTVTWGTDSSGIDTTEATKELTLEKGEYTIAMNGSRIYTITCVAAE